MIACLCHQWIAEEPGKSVVAFGRLEPDMPAEGPDNSAAEPRNNQTDCNTYWTGMLPQDSSPNWKKMRGNSS